MRKSLVLLLLISAGHCRGDRGQVLTLAEYSSELERWSAAVEKAAQSPHRLQLSFPGAWSSELPEFWVVDARGQSVRIHTERLRGMLRSGEYGQAQAWLSEMRSAAADLAGLSAINESMARHKLEEVLARPEFDQENNWRYRLAMKVAEWITDLLSLVTRPARTHPWVARLLLWATVFASVALFLIWLLKLLIWLPAKKTTETPAAEQAPDRWMRFAFEAQTAASQQDFRNAIRLAYWAGILRLEESGLWKADITRTPREYLRVLSREHPHRDGLSEVTAGFEQTWYGGRPASADQFRQLVAHLEGMGCRIS